MAGIFRGEQEAPDPSGERPIDAEKQVPITREVVQPDLPRNASLKDVLGDGYKVINVTQHKARNLRHMTLSLGLGFRLLPSLGEIPGSSQRLTYTFTKATMDIPETRG